MDCLWRCGRDFQAFDLPSDLPTLDDLNVAILYR